MLATASMLAAACGGGGSADGGGGESSAPATTVATSSGAARSGSGPDADSDSGTGDGRLAVSYEGGIAVLDGQTLEVVESFDSEEFTRLNAAGDGRTVLVTMSDGFQVLDTARPELTDQVFAAETPGHVVRHAGKTVLYDDGTSDTTIVDTAALAGADTLPPAEVIPGTTAHHGVSIVLSDGTLLTTIGDDGRTGARAVDTGGEEIARAENCPGIHGEGTAAGETVVFGCEDGALMYHHGRFEKLDAPDEYGRMGNAYVSKSSPLIVGDYKDDPDAEGVLLTQIALIDPDAHTLEVVDLPDGLGYTWRGVVRGPGDKAYLLGTDGAMHVVDPATGEISESYDVIDAWEPPAEWQDPHPGMVVDGDIAYINEPATSTIHAVDLTTGEVVASGQTPGVPNEMAVALG